MDYVIAIKKPCDNAEPLYRDKCQTSLMPKALIAPLQSEARVNISFHVSSCPDERSISSNTLFPLAYIPSLGCRPCQFFRSWPWHRKPGQKVCQGRQLGRLRILIATLCCVHDVGLFHVATWSDLRRSLECRQWRNSTRIEGNDYQDPEDITYDVDKCLLTWLPFRTLRSSWSDQRQDKVRRYCYTIPNKYSIDVVVSWRSFAI